MLLTISPSFYKPFHLLGPGFVIPLVQLWRHSPQSVDYTPLGHLCCALRAPPLPCRFPFPPSIRYSTSPFILPLRGMPRTYFVFTAFPARPSVVRAPLLLAYDTPKLIQFYLSNLDFSWVEYSASSFNRTFEGRAAAFVQFPKSLLHGPLSHVLVDTLAYAHIGRSGIHNSYRSVLFFA